MQERIAKYDVNVWAEDYFTQLNNIKEKQSQFEFMFLDAKSKQLLYEKYNSSSSSELLFDYDGTLVPFSNLPENAQPTEPLLTLLQALAKDKRNSIYIISGRDSKTLEKWLGSIGINLIAEHGSKLKLANESWKVDTNIAADDNWKEAIFPVMELYVKRCTNTFIEEKEFSVVWHFRNARAYAI